jgi:hypothetical protein
MHDLRSPTGHAAYMRTQGSSYLPAIPSILDASDDGHATVTQSRWCFSTVGSAVLIQRARCTRGPHCERSRDRVADPLRCHDKDPSDKGSMPNAHKGTMVLEPHGQVLGCWCEDASAPAIHTSHTPYALPAFPTACRRGGKHLASLAVAVRAQSHRQLDSGKIMTTL